MTEAEEIAKITNISAKMMEQAFAHIPGLSLKERALIVSIGAKLYNCGARDVLEDQLRRASGE